MSALATIYPGVQGDARSEPCEVCGRVAAPGKRHPCRFEVACTCWYSIPCSGRGTITGTRADRKAAGLR